MRGLKPYRDTVWSKKKGVASFTDAWIETVLRKSEEFALRSHLLQMRGLKQNCKSTRRSSDVASFTDAWIETMIVILNISVIASRIFYRCVD